MLTTLTIKNFVIVKEATIHFQKGLSVITGETGSGKSVVLSAIRFAFGAKSDALVVKPNTSAAEIALTINITELPSARQWLTEEGFLSQNETTITIHRTISNLGRSKCLLGGKNVTLNQLKILASHVLQMHGQHQHQSLLKVDEQLRLLDALASTKDLLKETSNAFQSWKQIKIEKEQLEKKAQQSGEIALLRYQSEELNNLGLSENEWEQLSTQHKRLANASSHQEACEKALTLLESEEGLAVLNALHVVDSTISALEVPNLTDLIESARINLSEAIDTLKDQRDQFDSDPQALHQVESRLSQLYEIARKHHVEPGALYAHSIQLEEELSQLENLSDALANIDTKINQAFEHYHSFAKKLSARRQKAALTLSKRITECLQPMGMSGATFFIHVEYDPNSQPCTDGADRINFCIQTNPEQSAQPLAKIASGGELSRVALAIEALTAEHLTGATLIFDEVDVGIGGQTGITIGSTIKALSNKRQVLCVTHLPQVAAFADTHYRIQKHVTKKSAEFSIEQLNPEQSIEALASMLGGNADNSQAKAHAKTLLEQASLV